MFRVLPRPSAEGWPARAREAAPSRLRRRTRLLAASSRGDRRSAFPGSASASCSRSDRASSNCLASRRRSAAPADTALQESGRDSESAAGVPAAAAAVPRESARWPRTARRRRCLRRRSARRGTESEPRCSAIESCSTPARANSTGLACLRCSADRRDSYNSRPWAPSGSGIADFRRMQTAISTTPAQASSNVQTCRSWSADRADTSAPPPVSPAGLR